MYRVRMRRPRRIVFISPLFKTEFTQLFRRILYFLLADSFILSRLTSPSARSPIYTVVWCYMVVKIPYTEMHHDSRGDPNMNRMFTFITSA